MMAFSAANVMPHEAGASHYETASVDAGGQRGEVQANHQVALRNRLESCEA